MLFLLDANIPYSAKKVFTAPHKALHVRDLKLANASDKKIFSVAQKLKCAVITRDLDFASIITYPPGTHYGIIILRVPFSFVGGEIINVMQRFFNEIDAEELIGATTIVEPGRYRIRKP